ETGALEETRREAAVIDSREAVIRESGENVAELAGRIIELDRSEGDLTGRVQAWDRLETAMANATIASERIDALNKAAEAAIEAELNVSVRLAELMARLADPETLAAEREAATIRRDIARENSRLTQEAESVSATIFAAKASQATAIERSGRAEKDRDELARRIALVESSLDRDAAIRLSVLLEPGAPCPVCGSADHPSPASDKNSRAEASGLQAERKALSERLRAADTELAEAGADVRSLNERIEEYLKRLAELPDRADSIRVRESLQEAERILILADCAEKDNVANAREVSNLRGELDASRLEARACQARVAEAAALMAAADAAVEEARRGAGQGDPRAALKAVRLDREQAVAEKVVLETATEAWRRERESVALRMSDLVARIETAAVDAKAATGKAKVALESAGFQDRDAWAAALLERIDLAEGRKKAAAYDEACASARARLLAAERLTSAGQRPDIPAVQARLQAMTEAHRQAREAAELAALRERDLASRLAGLDEAEEKRVALRDRGEALTSLASLLNGETSGRRLSFKNYVLASYFSRVANRASVRLREMSDGRYDLRVTEGRNRGRVGLDLEVADAFTGRSRPASSLSGGEKFLTSIALALGLSDVIVRGAGGVSLDSIFIDEGFGTLDEDMLDKVMAALDRVRGNRIIGIVSHVPELRSRVPARIEVRKTRAGSRLEVFGL
ncbi:MAG: hypothetical protein E4H20_06370, partial [Spirochaetales bacterium]